MQGLGGKAALSAVATGFYLLNRMKSREPNEDKAVLKRSIGEIYTLSKHFHFQSCLWPHAGPENRSCFLANSTQGTEPWEHAPVYTCWKEWMSG